MDYLDGRITTEEFINMRNSKSTKDLVRWALNMFDYFTKASFNEKSCEKVVLDIEKEYFLVCNKHYGRVSFLITSTKTKSRIVARQF